MPLELADPQMCCGGRSVISSLEKPGVPESRSPGTAELPRPVPSRVSQTPPPRGAPNARSSAERSAVAAALGARIAPRCPGASVQLRREVGLGSVRTLLSSFPTRKSLGIGVKLQRYAGNSKMLSRLSNPNKKELQRIAGFRSQQRVRGHRIPGRILTPVSAPSIGVDRIYHISESPPCTRRLLLVPLHPHLTPGATAAVPAQHSAVGAADTSGIPWKKKTNVSK